MAFLLCTGVSVNLIAQHLSDLKFADQQAHILPSVKFISTFIFATLIQNKTSSAHAPYKHVTHHQKRLMWLIGLLDATAYVCFCYGFAACGATLSSIILSAMGQLFTALATRFVLHKKLSWHQILSIALVCFGLVVRYIPSNTFHRPWKELSFSLTRDSTAYRSSFHASFDQNQVQGFAFIVVAAALYSCLGIAYEALTTNITTPPPPYPIIAWYTSSIGLIGACTYQALYLLPRWSALVRRPYTASAVSLPSLLFLLMLFGAAFNLHMYAQSLVFKQEGALGVSLVNAVRGAAVTVVVGLLFCSKERPLLCLTMQSGVAACIVTAGGVLWVLDGNVHSARVQKQETVEIKERRGSMVVGKMIFAKKDL